MSWVDSFFAWPNGGVWSNLVASAITSTGALLLVGWRILKKQAVEHEKHRQLMARQLAEHHEQVMGHVAAKLAEHHAAVLAAVASEKEEAA